MGQYVRASLLGERARRRSLVAALALTVITAGVAALLNAESEPQSALALAPSKEITYPGGLRFPQAAESMLAHTVAVEPDGDHFWALVPPHAEPKFLRREQIQEEETSGSKRVFRLQRVNLDTREVVAQRDLVYDLDRGENFGFRLSPDGQHLCTLSDGKLLVLDVSLQVLEEIETGLKTPDGELLSGDRCYFSPDDTSLLIRYGTRGIDYDARDVVVFHNWRQRRITHVEEFESLVMDAVPLRNGQLLVMHRKPRWLYRYRVARLALTEDSSEPVWEVNSREFGRNQIIVSRNRLFLATHLSITMSDVPRIVPSPTHLQDYNNPPWREEFPRVDRTITSLLKNSGKGKKNFEYSGYWLQWPAAVSPDSRWLAACAIHWTHLEYSYPFFHWDDTRLVIFDVDGDPDKPVFVSENFGPEQAIMDLAFTPDGSKLIVATTARLIVYNIKETTAEN